MAEKNMNYNVFNDDEETILDLDIRTEIRFSKKDHPQGKMIPVPVEGKEEYILIPLDAKDGDTIKISGRGKHNSRSGKTGDLYVMVSIEGEKPSGPKVQMYAAILVLFAVLIIAAFVIGTLAAHLSLSKKGSKMAGPTPKISTSPTSANTHTRTDAAYDTSETGSTSDSAEDAAKENPVIKANDIVTFGSYEQDGLQSNGSEPIEWRVLEVQESKALLLSRYALDSKPYNDIYKTTTWENCTLRKWLNTTFLDTAFTSEEQSDIIITEIDNSRLQGNIEWQTDGGNNTEDAVFLLSYADTDRYFDSASDRKCTPTNYAMAMGADIRTGDDGVSASGWWWLRSPGEGSSQAAFVNFDGTRYTNAVGNGYLSVRPALWVKLDGLQLS